MGLFEALPFLLAFRCAEPLLSELFAEELFADWLSFDTTVVIRSIFWKSVTRVGFACGCVTYETPICGPMTRSTRIIIMKFVQFNCSIEYLQVKTL